MPNQQKTSSKLSAFFHSTKPSKPSPSSTPDSASDWLLLQNEIDLALLSYSANGYALPAQESIVAAELTQIDSNRCLPREFAAEELRVTCRLPKMRVVNENMRRV